MPEWVVRMPRHLSRRSAGLAGLLAMAIGLSDPRLPAARAQGGVASFSYRVLATYPHDARAYTQGLLYRDGVLYESTGLNGRSSLRKVRLETGEVLQERAVDAQHFAEGLVDWGNRLIQLTWRSNVGFVYDLKTFAPVTSFSYSGEGWGLTSDGTRLIMSDGAGAGQLRFLDPATFKELGRVTVRDAGQPVANLNELEFVKGEVLANVYQTDRVARIDPKTGQVTAWIDLSGLLAPPERSGTDVLNGIAYDAKGDRLFVTGKLWPRLFEIRLERRR